jgi:hypothetical protein
MSPRQREQVRLSLLRYGLGGADAPLLGYYLRAEGFRVSARALALELEYLLDKGFLALAPKQISPENKVFRTTAAGRDYLAVQGQE